MKDVINGFYEAFAKLDAESMVAYYHDDVVFEDPAFGRLEGERAKNMWRMLCESQKGKQFVVMHSGVEADEDSGKADWEALYVFSKTKRNVRNQIRAKFRFEEGKIIAHADDFNLYRWARQALGAAGYLIGWTSFFQKQLQQQTNTLLDRFEVEQTKQKDAY